MTILYEKILVPYDGSKPSENALQQAIQLADLSLSASTTKNIRIILLHIVEEIHIRIPNLYFGLRILAGSSMNMTDKGSINMNMMIKRNDSGKNPSVMATSIMIKI